MRWWFLFALGVFGCDDGRKCTSSHSEVRTCIHPTGIPYDCEIQICDSYADKK